MNMFGGGKRGFTKEFKKLIFKEEMLKEEGENSNVSKLVASKKVKLI